MNESSNNKRIAKNTIFLYVRMLFSLIVSFFTAGIVLNVLGVTDYGIYSVVGGLVTTFSLISGSLSAASSRYITFELGKKEGKVGSVFNASLQIHVILAIVVLILLETGGLWFLCNKMTIPEDRLFEAIVVFQFSTISFILQLLSVSYNADIVAHEHMNTYAYISIVEVLLRLVVLFVLKFGNIDKLVLYGFLQMVVSAIIQCIYMVYCRKHFEESKLKFKIETKLIRSMIGFSGWNFIGSSASLLKNQGVDIIINLFLGPAANAARGIAISANNMISGFGNNLLAAINPQITKNFADGNHQYTMSLVNRASRFSFILLLLIAFPILVRTDLLLTIWLKNVPEHAVILTQLAIICTLIDILSTPLITLMLATGNIKWYQIIVGGTLLLNVPLSYWALKYGFGVESTMIIAAFVSVGCLILRLTMLKVMVSFNVKQFFVDVLCRILLIVTIAILFYLTTEDFFGSDFISSILYVIIAGIFNGIVILLIGLTKSERAAIFRLLASKLTRSKK